MPPIRVLIVDDSPFIRRVLERIFKAEPDIVIAGFAQNGEEAVLMTDSLRPDVITMDVMMPVMDGIDALKIIMDRCPTPVLMLSQFTHDGAELTLNALDLGAMDFIDKSSTGLMDFIALAKDIVSKVKAIAHSKPQAQKARVVEKLEQRTFAGDIHAVAIGTSTGGPAALQVVIPKFPGNISFGIVIVQHMPPGFTGPLAKRLNSMSQIEVREAEDGDRVRPGVALIAPAGLHMTLSRLKDLSHEGKGYYYGKVRLDTEPHDTLHKPSADVLFESVARCYAHRALGVVLTGMGSDGARGMKIIKDRGGSTIAQDEATSVIFGMPKAAIDKGVVDRVVPLNLVAEEIMKKA